MTVQCPARPYWNADPRCDEACHHCCLGKVWAVVEAAKALLDARLPEIRVAAELNLDLAVDELRDAWKPDLHLTRVGKDAQTIEARRGETEGLDAKRESVTPQSADAP